MVDIRWRILGDIQCNNLCYYVNNNIPHNLFVSPKTWLCRVILEWRWGNLVHVILQALSYRVIFLWTHSLSYSHKSVYIHKGVEHDASKMLTTIPPMAFNEVFYLNLSHPLYAKLFHIVLFTSLNSLKRSKFGLSTIVGPPPVGITEYWTLVL